MNRLVWCVLVLAYGVGVVCAQTAEVTNPALPKIEARAKEVAESLAAGPRGPAAPITQRAVWVAAAKRQAFSNIVSQAEPFIGKKPAPFDEAAYREYYREGGDRYRYEQIRGQRYAPLACLVISECIENKGRFISTIADLIMAICDEPSWVLPAHDFDAAVLDGKDMYVDLVSAVTSADLAMACYWLGDKLPPVVSRRVAAEIERRTLEPYRRSITSERPLPRMRWTRAKNNWNAVCHAGVIAAALLVEPSKEQRAWYIAAAEHNMETWFLAGFTDDGYCSEGLGYWNYGFGHFVDLAETLARETAGKVDLFENPKVRNVAMFGPRMEITPGIFAAFADCGTSPNLEPIITAFLSRRLGLGLRSYEARALYPNAPLGSLLRTGLYAFPNTASVRPAVADKSALPLRSEFPDGGVFICRPRDVTSGDLAVVFKGGHNNETHNHNDVGTFVVVRGSAVPLLDPGGEVYTQRTFSSDRYKSQLLNSFGHPVPRVNGRLQAQGGDRRGNLLEQENSDAEERYRMDIAPAYKCRELKTLVRELLYRRNDRGTVEVRDTFEFTEPGTFETALITYKPFRTVGAQEAPVLRLIVGDDAAGQQVRVTVTSDVPNAVLVFEATEITEDATSGRRPMRLSFSFKEPLTRGTVTTVVQPH